MIARTKELFKGLVEQQILQLSRDMADGKPLSDGQQQAIATHALALQVGEVAAALGRIYMSLEARKDKA